MKREENIRAESKVQSSEFRACQNDIVGHVPGLKKFNLSAVSFAPEKSGQAVEFIQWIKEISPDMRLTVQNRLAHSALTRFSKELAAGFVCRISPSTDGVRGSASLGMQVTMQHCQQRVTSNQYPTSSIQHPATSNKQSATKIFSTVYQITKPSATGTSCLAEGCISESQAIRAA